MPFSRYNFAYQVLIGLAALNSPPQAIAQDEMPSIDTRPWRLVLEQQLLSEKSCGLLEVLLFDEFKKEEETILEGKIACVDGRKFDFLRRHLHQKFELNLCEPAVC